MTTRPIKPPATQHKPTPLSFGHREITNSSDYYYCGFCFAQRGCTCLHISSWTSPNCFSSLPSFPTAPRATSRRRSCSSFKPACRGQETRASAYTHENEGFLRYSVYAPRFSLFRYHRLLESQGATSSILKRRAAPTIIHGHIAPTKVLLYHESAKQQKRTYIHTHDV